MTHFKTTFIRSSAIAALTLLATTAMASASPLVSVLGVFAQSTGPTGAAPFALLNLGTGSANSFQTSNSFAVGGETISFSGGTGHDSTQSGEYTGNNSGVYASPFGNTNSTSKYLSAGAEGDSFFDFENSPGVVTITFATAQTSLNLLWGSVDFSDQNQLQISADNFTITGATVEAMDPSQLNPPGPSGSGDFDAYVSITGLAAFNTVTFSDLSNNAAFEFVPGAPASTPVPEPITLSLFSAGLAGAAVIRRRKSARQV